MLDTRLIILAIALLATGVWSYTSRYDNVDVEEILKNQRLYSKYFTCLTHTDASKCTTDGRELRRIVPDALATGCSKCTAQQLDSATKVIKYISEHKPEDFKKLLALYDPTGEYKRTFATKAAERGIKL
nr:chemosensory protein [Corythucha ciliata]